MGKEGGLKLVQFQRKLMNKLRPITDNFTSFYELEGHFCFKPKWRIHINEISYSAKL
jgi:hypothetical protein